MMISKYNKKRKLKKNEENGTVSPAVNSRHRKLFYGISNVFTSRVKSINERKIYETV